MGLHFILGRAGTGKTHTCLEAIRARASQDPAGPPLVLLVPEQATFQMEQALLGGSSPLRGMIRAQVLSFQRLAWRVSLKAGGLPHPPLSDLGKRMVLRALLENRKDQLRLFGQVADRPGFIEKLAGTISELRTYQQDPASLRAYLGTLERRGEGDSPLGAKLHDLAMVMEDLRAYTTDRFTDPDDYLTVLAERLPGSGVLDGAEVWVDAFTGFTPQELAVLGAILQSAERVHVTLCVDPLELKLKVKWRDPADLFHPTLVTYDQLLALAGERGVEVEPAHILWGEGDVAPRFRKAPELGYLERHLFAPQARPWEGEAPAITIAAAQNRREEVEAAAREVLRLVRDQGLRYREIAIVTRNLDAYGDLAATVFAEHSIPVFVDRRRTVAHHPLVELLRSALEVVIQDWAYGPVFRYLKTDLTGASRTEVDQLENYVIEHGIRGKSWHDGMAWAWLRRYTLEEDRELTSADVHRLERINRIRDRAAAELIAFHRRLGGRRGRRPRTVREITTALFHLLDDLKVAARLEKWSADAEAAGDLEAAREHAQVWSGVLDLLDQIVEALGDVEMSLQQYLQVLAAGLDGLRLGLIPPGLDQVVIGTVERSRHSGVKATLILGATEKDFPPLPPEDAIFTDREREQMDEDDLKVGPTSLLRLFQEQFFTYVALTRGSERLWISYPLADDGGRAVAPSPVIRRLQQLFPSVPEVAVSDPSPDSAGILERIVTPSGLAAAMARAFRQHRSGYPLEPIWLDLYQWAAREPELRRRVAPIMASVKYEESFRQRTAAIGGELAGELYGGTLMTSVSRLESFLSCPFQHFAGYGLRLQERARFQVSAPELGLFYHAALSLFVRNLEQEGLTWDQLTREQAAARMDRLVDELAPRLQSEILLSSPQHGYVLRVMRRTLQASLNFLSDHIEGSRFRPLFVELPFGEEEGQGLPPVDIVTPGGNRVLLRGRIDRVDGWKKEDGTWHLRVMDYKSSPRTLDLGRFYHGLSMQLLLYLYAVVAHAGLLLEGAEARPAGALYFPVFDPIERLEGPEPAEKVLELRRKRYRATGLVTADPELVRAMDLTGAGLTQVKLNKDGSVRKGAPVAPPDHWEHLFRHLRLVVGRAAEQVLHGEVGVAPYRMAGLSPCSTCRFRAVCQFDPTVEGQGYRSLERLKGPDVWEKLLGGEGDE